MIEPFSKEWCQGASYDLALGREYYVFRPEWDQPVVRALGREEHFIIPPGELAYLITEETLSIPDNLQARVSLALSLTRESLILGAQPPIDPNYHGRIVCLVHNLGHRQVSLAQGKHVITIEFYRLDKATTKRYETPGHIQNLEKLRQVILEPKTTVNAQLEREMKGLQRWVMVTASALFVLLALGAAVGQLFQGCSRPSG